MIAERAGGRPARSCTCGWCASSRHRADPDDPGRDLRDDHPQLGLRLVLDRATSWRTRWPRLRPTRRSTASRCRPTPASSATFSTSRRRDPLLVGGQLRDLLTRGQLQMQRALPKAYIIDGDGQLRARRAELPFWYAPPSPEIERARTGEPVIIQDWENNEFWALLQLPAFADHFLYVSRDVDGKILSLLDETQETVRLYQQLEADRAAASSSRSSTRVRAGGDPRGDVDGALVRRAAGAAGRAARRGGGAGRAGRPRRAGARRRATTRSRSSGAPSTR